MDIIEIIAITGSLAIFFIVIDFIRRGVLKEKYSLLWLFASIILITFSLSRDLLHFLAEILGIFYPPSLLFIIAFIFLLLITLHFSVIISGLAEKNKRLAQEIGILKLLIEDLYTKINKTN